MESLVRKSGVSGKIQMVGETTRSQPSAIAGEAPGRSEPYETVAD